MDGRVDPVTPPLPEGLRMSVLDDIVAGVREDLDERSSVVSQAQLRDAIAGGRVLLGGALAAGLSEPRDTIEDVVEPFLIQLGLVARTARGRCLNGRGWTHLGLNPPAGAQTGLFDAGDMAK